MQFLGKYLPSVSSSLWGYWHKFIPSSNPKEKSLANKGAMKSLFVVISVVLRRHSKVLSEQWGDAPSC